MLKKVKRVDKLLCGVSTGIMGFSAKNKQGKWTGIDVDYCKAISAAVLKNKNKVKFISLPPQERFTALRLGDIDILTENTTWNGIRDTAMELSFVGVTYYDGQGFLTNKSRNIKNIKDLKNTRICIQEGTTAITNTQKYFKSHHIRYKLSLYESRDELIKQFRLGKCDVLTTDQSQLYEIKSKLAYPKNYIVLPDVISKEPLGPAVREGDDRWFKIARWTLFALIEAEELGITQKNVDSLVHSKNPKISRLLGRRGNIGKYLGLDNKWAYRIIKQVGNYGEIFERNLGQKSPLKIKRGLNALWKDGGLMYAMPQ